MDDTFPPPAPRLQGIQEHYRRAAWLISLADAASAPDEQYRLLMSAMYFARGIVELMLDAAKSQELPKYRGKDEQKCRKGFEQDLAPKLPHYFLIEKIRIHDFHRFGCVPPNPKGQEVFFGGTMKLTAKKGAATLSIPAAGPQVTLTGESSVKDQRSLCKADGSFYDDVSHKYLPLRQILVEHIGEDAGCTSVV